MIHRIIRIIGILAFVGIVIITIIFLFVVPVDRLIELLFTMHKKALIVVGIVFVGMELLYFLLEFVEKLIKKAIDVKKLITHLLWGCTFLFLVFADLAFFEKIAGPKLVKVVILYPHNGEKVSLHTDVEVFVRKVEDRFVYIIVQTPQGTMWIHGKLFTSQFKDKLKGRARLGEGEAGIGETFKIFAIATKEEIRIGVLPALPSKYILSNVVEVRRAS